MGRGTRRSRRRKRKLSDEAKAFIAGRTNKFSLPTQLTQVARGPEFVLGRSRGTGAHGKRGKALHRSERKAVKLTLRRDDLDAI